MGTLADELAKHITKPLGSYHNEEELTQILKKRLTKKEYKLLLSWTDETTDPDAMRKKLKLTGERHKQLSDTIVKKLNHDTLKREITLL